MVNDDLSKKVDYLSMDVVPIEMPESKINHSNQKYPYCIVWTPIPFLTWILPVIGHMGVATSSGVIRDFAGPYHVGTDKMAFGKPTKYWKLDPLLAVGGVEGWDKSISEASDVYKNRNHNFFFDNCHSHVALALNKMNYNSTSNWNVIKLACGIFFHGRYVNFLAFVKTWLPFIIFIILIVVLACVT